MPTIKRVATKIPAIPLPIISSAIITFSPIIVLLSKSVQSLLCQKLHQVQSGFAIDYKYPDTR